MGQNAVITGWGFYAPSRVVTNFDLEKLIDTSDAWIRERTGIERRHIAAEGETTVDLAEQAARTPVRTGLVLQVVQNGSVFHAVTPGRPLGCHYPARHIRHNSSP